MLARDLRGIILLVALFGVFAIVEVSGAPLRLHSSARPRLLKRFDEEGSFNLDGGFRGTQHSAFEKVPSGNFPVDSNKRSHSGINSLSSSPTQELTLPKKAKALLDEETGQSPRSLKGKLNWSRETYNSAATSGIKGLLTSARSGSLPNSPIKHILGKNNFNGFSFASSADPRSGALFHPSRIAMGFTPPEGGSDYYSEGSDPEIKPTESTNFEKSQEEERDHSLPGLKHVSSGSKLCTSSTDQLASEQQQELNIVDRLLNTYAIEDESNRQESVKGNSFISENPWQDEREVPSCSASMVYEQRVPNTQDHGSDSILEDPFLIHSPSAFQQMQDVPLDFEPSMRLDDNYVGRHSLHDTPIMEEIDYDHVRRDEADDAAVCAEVTRSSNGITGSNIVKSLGRAVSSTAKDSLSLSKNCVNYLSKRMSGKSHSSTTRSARDSKSIEDEAPVDLTASINSYAQIPVQENMQLSPPLADENFDLEGDGEMVE